MPFLRFCLVVPVIAIFCLGLVMIFNTSSAEVLDLGLSKNTSYALVRHTLYAGLGLSLAYVLKTLGYKVLLEMHRSLFILGCFLLVLVLIPGIGLVANGSRRWIGVAGITFQPSEIVKYIMMLYLVGYVVNAKATMGLKEFYKLMAITSIPVGLIVLEPNNGTAAVVVMVVISLLFLLRVPMRFWAIPMGVVATILVIAAFQLPYVTARLDSYLHPEKDILGKGHQPYQAKIAAGSGELFGKGPGQSIQKLSYLPEAQNDYIAAIYAEEFGFLGMLILLTLYLLVCYGGFACACRANDRAGCTLAAAITFLIGMQAFLNLGVVSGLLPSTGLNLPFFSQGGTSLVVNIAALGVLLDIGESSTKS